MVPYWKFNPTCSARSWSDGTNASFYFLLQYNAERLWGASEDYVNDAGLRNGHGRYFNAKGEDP